MSFSPAPTLYLLCGKIASGKSTLSAALAAKSGGVSIGEDAWLAQLYADELNSVADYVRCSAKLRGALKPHIIALLKAGVSVILDFPANTLSNRQWMMSLIVESGADHQLHYLKADDELCKTRLRARNAAGQHDFAASDAQFELITRYFVEPKDEEGFNLVLHEVR